jgi:hypothetical protein
MEFVSAKAHKKIDNEIKKRLQQCTCPEHSLVVLAVTFAPLHTTHTDQHQMIKQMNSKNLRPTKATAYLLTIL